jgi:hypothetical protein
MEFITVTDEEDGNLVRINIATICAVVVAASKEMATVYATEAVTVTTKPEEIAALDWWSKQQDIDIVAQHKRELYFESNPEYATYVQECMIFKHAILPYNEWQEAVKRDEEFQAAQLKYIAESEGEEE